jgi:hypothetical protein
MKFSSTPKIVYQTISTSTAQPHKKNIKLASTSPISQSRKRAASQTAILSFLMKLG